MANKIFFSWQADTPNKVGRSFLKEVLEEVCVSVASDTTLDEAMRDVEVDSDTQGVGGQPPIAETIFKKIDTASVFIADVTFTGKRDKDDRPTPNPNVLIEYGWAQKSHSDGKSISSERVICIMNAAYGKPNANDLPFDLAHLRWPITYNLPEDATPEIINKEKKELIKTLKKAIQVSLGKIPAPVVVPPPAFPEAVAKDGPDSFRAKGEAIGFDEDILGKHRELFLSNGSAMWLRLMPLEKPQKEWSPREIKIIAMPPKSLLMPLINTSGGYGFVRSSDGAGMYRSVGNITPDSKIIQTDAVAFAFKTGEVWSVETAMLSYGKDRLYMTEIEQLFAKGIEMYSRFIKELGIDPPYHWKAGLIGTKGRQLGYAAPPGNRWMRDGGPICAADLIEAEGKIELDQPGTTALLPFFKKIFEECGIERPDYLPQ